MTKKALLVAISSVLLAACSDDRPPPAGGGAVITAPPAPTNSSSSGGGGASSGAIPSATYCDDVKQIGDVVGEIALVNKPAPLGGALASGTYKLTEIDVYIQAQPSDAGLPVGGSTGNAARGTLYIEGEFLRLTTARGKEGADLPQDSVEAFKVRVDGTKLVLTPLCPSSGPDKSIEFSAVGGGLALFVEDRRELYTKQ